MTGRCCACFVWIVFAYLGLGHVAQAQHNADSLRQVWSDPSAPDTLRWDALSKLIWQEYMFSRPDSAEHLATLVFKEAEAKAPRPGRAMP